MNMKTPILYLCALTATAALLALTSTCTAPGTPTGEGANVRDFLARFAESGDTAQPPVTPSTYTLTVNRDPPDGGTVSVNGVASTGTTTHSAGASVTVAAAPRGDYVFAHWTGNVSGDAAANPMVIAMDANKSVTAVFAPSDEPPPVVYAVTFSTGGGSSVPEQSVVLGGRVSRPADPTHPWYTFIGWYMESTFATAWNFSTGVVSADMTLYAKWERSGGTMLIDARDGQSYHTVATGGQVWMAENLNSVPIVGNSWCYDNQDSYCAEYGRLYDWEAAMSVCPSGWRLPDAADWNALVNYAGDSSSAGAALKAVSGWSDGGNGTDDYGFSALPGGYRISGVFNNIGYDGYWWSATRSGNGVLRDNRGMTSYSDNVYAGMNHMESGNAVRCIQDNTVTPPPP